MDKIVKVIANIIFAVILFGGLFWTLSYFVKEQKKEQVHLYQISFGNTLVWTKEIKFRNDGAAEFVDLNSNRKFIVYGSYAIIQPKTK